MSERARFLFEPGRVRVGARGVGGITRGGGLGRGGVVGGGRAGGARGHGQGGGLTNFGQLVAALGAVAAARGQGVPSPPDVPGALTLISTTTLAAPGTFDLTGIPQTYNDLLVVALLRSSAALASDFTLLTFNGDSGSNYAMQLLESTGTTTTSSTPIARANILFTHTAAASATAGYFSYMRIFVPGYAVSTWNKYAALLHYSGQGLATAGYVQETAGMWQSTAAINRLTIVPNTAPTTFVTGSQVRLYGLT